jgi:RND family efflux transporter MFP subunit
MKNLIKYSKICIVFLGIVAIFYGIMATLDQNVSLQKAQAQQAKVNPLTSIKTILIEPTSIQSPLTLVGTLKPYQTLEFLSDVEGKITEISFDLHQHVSAGQILAKTDTKIKKTQSNIAELTYKKAKRDFERLEALHKNKNLSDNDLENARFQMQNAEQNFVLTQQTIDYTTITSPMNGYITQKNIAKGKYLQLGSPIATITDVSQLRLMVNVAPQDLPKINIGAIIPIKIPSQNLENISGIVKSISVQSNEAGSFSVEILVANNYNLRAGMQAEVFVSENTNAQRNVILIPRLAILGGDAVFVVENKKVIRKKITLGREYNENVEIISGLQKGENLVVKGQHNVADKEEIQAP